MTVSIVKYSVAALAVGMGAWIPATHQVPFAVGLGVMLIGLVVAAVVCEREAFLGEAIADRPERLSERAITHRERVLIVGAGAVGRSIAESLDIDNRYDVVGFVDDQADPNGDGVWPVLGGRSATSAIIERYHVDEVILAYAPTWQQLLVEELAENRPDVRVRVVPSAYEALMQTASVESVGDVALVRLAQAGPRDLLKRAFDLTGAAVGLLVLAPLMLVVAALIKLTSRGPVIFAQERVGRYGRSFVLYKFRTMIHNAEAKTGPILSSGKDDNRLTPLGRWLKLFRLDEIPQLWNVLRGDMSIVGPRPERRCFVRKFEQLVPSYSRRHQVRPGITGLAQVCGGYHTDARDKLRFDLIYVSHQSLWLDLLILLRTILVVCRSGR